MSESKTKQQLYSVFNLVDVDEERTILAAMRDDVEFAEEVGKEVDEDYFSDDMRKIAFLAMKVLSASSDPYEPQGIAYEANRIAKEIKIEIKITPEFVTALNGPTEKARSLKSVLIDKGKRRKLVDCSTLITENIGTTSPDLLWDEVVQIAEKSKSRSQVSRVVYGPTTQDFLRVELKKDSDRKASGYLAPKYPWDNWNTYVLPPEAGKITLFGAPDGIGKSTFAQRIAEGWASQGFQVAYVHAEDTLKKILQRRMCHYAQINLKNIEAKEEGGEVTLKGSTTEEDREMWVADQRISQWSQNLHYVNMIGCNIVDCVYELDAMKKDGKCDIAIVDYLGAFATTRGQGRMERHAKVVDESDRLTMMSGKSGIPVFVVAQGTKEMIKASGDDIGREHLYGGAPLYHRAGTVILFLRDKQADGVDLRDKQGRLVASGKSYSPATKIIVDKQNDGDTGAFQQFFEGRYFSVHDRPFWI